MSGFAVLLEAAVERQVMDEKKEMQACVTRIRELETRLSENEKTLKNIVKTKKKGKRKRRPRRVKRAGASAAATANVPLRKCQACKVVKRSTVECGPVPDGRCLVCVRTGRRCFPSYDRRRKDVVGGRWDGVALKKTQ